MIIVSVTRLAPLRPRTWASAYRAPANASVTSWWLTGLSTTVRGPYASRSQSNACGETTTSSWSAGSTSTATFTQ